MGIILVGLPVGFDLTVGEVANNFLYVAGTPLVDIALLDTLLQVHSIFYSKRIII